MFWRLLAIVIVVLTTVAVPGCKKKSEPAEPAEVTVTEENLDTELDKMEEQIEADIAAEGE